VCAWIGGRWLLQAKEFKASENLTVKYLFSKRKDAVDCDCFLCGEIISERIDLRVLQDYLEQV